jgi:glycosyltransferase involved in cell wall biosynthesis
VTILSGRAAPRVAVLAHASSRYSFGGGEIAAQRECELLREHGIEVLLAGAIVRPNNQFAPAIELINDSEAVFAVNDYDIVHEVWKDNQAVAELIDLVCRHEPDIVHFHHCWHIGLNTMVRMRRRLPSARFVLTLHDMLAICINHGQMVRTTGELCRHYDRVSCNGCFPDRSVQSIERRRRAYLSVFELMASYIYPSEFIRNRFEAWGLDKTKGMVLENILDRKSETAISDSPREAGEFEQRRFGFFGQVTGFKGINVLIKATAIAKARASDFVVYIYGATRERIEQFFPELKPTIDALGATLLFAGRYAPTDVYRLMRRCDWVIVPSIWWENSPVVIQEALAANVPLIVSDIGGMAEKVRDGLDGLHFRVGDYVDLAEKISRNASRRRAQEIQRTMVRPISNESFLKGLEKAFAVPLIDGAAEGPSKLTPAD